MEEVQTISEQCSTEWACTTREGADRIVLRLEECRNYLTKMLNSTVTGPIPSTKVLALMELHVVISWETTQERLDSTAGSRRRETKEICSLGTRPFAGGERVWARAHTLRNGNYAW